MRKRGVDGFRVLQSEEKEKYQTIMLQITLDMYQTLAAAVVVLLAQVVALALGE